MSLSKLMRLIPPPTEPVACGSIERWPRIEEELGTALPSEYKEFIGHYGSGQLANFYNIYNPFSSSKYGNLLERVEILRSIYTEHRFERCPLPFPSPGGILPWACDDNGNFYFWITGGAPDSWKVAIDEVRGEGYQTFHLSMSEYLLAVLEKRIDSLAGNYPISDCFHFQQFEESGS